MLLACVKLLYDRIISLRGEIFDRKTNLTWPLLNKVTVSTKESERSCIYVLGYRFYLFWRFFYWILELFWQYEIFLIFLYSLKYYIIQKKNRQKR
jgi:hypothetical protein